MKHFWLSALLVAGLGLISLDGAAQEGRHSRLGIGVYTDLFNACPGLQAEYDYRFTPWFSVAAQLSDEASWRKNRCLNRATAMVYALFRPFPERGFWHRFELGAGAGYENCFKSYPAETVYTYNNTVRSLSNESYTTENKNFASFDVPLKFYIVDNSRYDIGLCVTYRLRVGSEIIHGLTIGLQLGAKF